MKMIMAEFSGKRVGFFRPKPVLKCGGVCPLCGSNRHIGRTTCEIKTIEWLRPLSYYLAKP